VARSELENIPECRLQFLEEIEMPAFLLVTMIAMAIVMPPVMRFVGRAGAGEGRGGFQSQDYRYYVRSFLKKVTSGFIC
jgi:hypothetical protein